MPIFTVIGIALGLAMDATAVSVAASVTLGRVSARQVFRFAFHFGLFQAVMPMLGWLAGRQLYSRIAAWDHWVAFALLIIIGSKALWDARGSGDDGAHAVIDPTRGWRLVALSIATSLDAMAVGLSFAMLGVAIWMPCLVIGLVTAALSTAGMLLASRLGPHLGRRLRGLGGVVLVGIGVQILVSHLRAQ
jgi:manganese efflux pump family protein